MFSNTDPLRLLVYNERKFICSARHLIWDLDSLPGQLARLVDLARPAILLSLSLAIMYSRDTLNTLPDTT
jgi:hypothetical protein